MSAESVNPEEEGDNVDETGENSEAELPPVEKQNSAEKATVTGTEVEAYEDLLRHCGDSGRWQLKLFMLNGFGGMFTAFHALAYAFIGAIPDHWCKLPNVEGMTKDEVKKLTIPGGSNCFRCDVKGEWDTGKFSKSDVNCNKTVACTAWDYDMSDFMTTIASEFDLVCTKTYLVSLVQASYMFGILVGSPTFGAMSDKLGRRKTILISALIFCIAGPVIGFAPNYYAMMFGRFILGLSTPGVFATSFVLVIENVGLDWRGLAGNLFNLWFAVGYILLPLFAYFLREWRQLQLALCVPSVALLISWWFSCESPRWLIRVGRVDQAEVILRGMAKTNRKELPEDFSELCMRISDANKQLTVTSKKSMIELITKCKVLTGFADLLRSKRIRTRTLVIYFCWFSIGMIYYGLALNSPNLSTDRYIYTLVGGLLEVPSSFMVPPLIRYFGRRYVFSGLILVTGIALLVSLAFNEGSPAIVILALVGKLAVGAAFALIYVYATEVFPTLVRTYGLGAASMFGRVGSVSAPFVVDLVGKEMSNYPTIVFGVVSIASGLSALLLPETKGRRLPETIKEVEMEFS